MVKITFTLPSNPPQYFPYCFLQLLVFRVFSDDRGTIKVSIDIKYVVKHKSAKLFMTYAVGKLEAALNISHLILSTSSQRVR